MRMVPRRHRPSSPLANFFRSLLHRRALVDGGLLVLNPKLAGEHPIPGLGINPAVLNHPGRFHYLEHFQRNIIHRGIFLGEVGYLVFRHTLATGQSRADVVDDFVH